MSTLKPIPAPNLFLWAYQLWLAIFGVAYLLLRFVRGRGIPGIRERLGWYPRSIREVLGTLDRPIWIHLVSVGEVLAAEPLIQRLRQQWPDRSWVITTVTPTGRSVAQRFIRQGKDQFLYLPWDLGPIVRRAIRAIRPGLFISLETELWPVLFFHLGCQGVPVVVVNGRISPKALRRYLLVRPWMTRFLRPVRLFMAQSPSDARRFAAMGAAQDRIVVTGNLKWDSILAQEAPGEDHLRQLLKLSEQAILLTAGSTHPGEETLLLEVYRQLKSSHPSLRLLIAPRHPERIVEVKAEVLQAGFSVVRRSQLGGSDPRGSDPIILLDTVGELTHFYRISDLIFVGGSLVSKGGHNLVEPAVLGKPILTGSHLENFHAIAESLARAGGIVVVSSPAQLQERLVRLIEDPRLRQELGARAFQAIQEHRGATERTVQGILRAMEPCSLS